MRYDGVDWIILLLLFMLILTEGQAGETWENSEKKPYDLSENTASSRN